MADYLDEVCGFLAGCRFEDLSEGAVERARRVLADSMAAISAGSREPEVIALTEKVATCDGPAMVIGAGIRTEPGKAAFLNGTADATTLESPYIPDTRIGQAAE